MLQTFSEATSFSGVDGKKVIYAIVALKSYCIEAAKTDYFDENKDASTANALIGICKKFSRSDPHQDVVTQFGTVIGELTEMPSYRGVFQYLTEHVNHNILRGQSVLETAKGQVIFSNKVLGLRDRPKYIKKLAVKAANFADTQSMLNAGDSGAAIANWIKSGTAHYYEQALGRHTKQINAIAAEKELKCNSLCLEAIRAAYKNHCPGSCSGVDRMIVVNKMTLACHAGVWRQAPKECAWRKPNPESIKKRAMAEAQKAMIAAAKKTNEARVVMEIEEKAKLKKEKQEKAVAAEKARIANIQSMPKCAEEGGMCYCKGEVFYGAEDKWVGKHSLGGRISCTNQVFGDPIHKVVKDCLCGGTKTDKCLSLSHAVKNYATCCEGDNKRVHGRGVVCDAAARKQKSSKCPSAFPYPSHAVGTSGIPWNGRVCYNNKAAAARGSGSCSSWCTNDLKMNDGCGGCCGNYAKKACSRYM